MSHTRKQARIIRGAKTLRIRTADGNGMYCAGLASLLVFRALSNRAPFRRNAEPLPFSRAFHSLCEFGCSWYAAFSLSSFFLLRLNWHPSSPFRSVSNTPPPRYNFTGRFRFYSCILTRLAWSQIQMLYSNRPSFYALARTMHTHTNPLL